MAKVDFYPQEILFNRNKRLLYRGKELQEIAFPLGGIGAGCISLAGSGALVDWEIFNRPNKGVCLPYTFFAIHAAVEGKKPVTRVLQAPPTPPYTGRGCARFAGIGFGVNREQGSGLPHMRSATFRGEFPMAYVYFTDPTLPVEVTLEAFSPFIPVNAHDSGMPIAILRYHLHNPNPQPVAVSIVGNLFNAIGYCGTGLLDGRRGRADLGQNVNRYQQEDGLRGLFMFSERYPPNSPRFGSLALCTTWPQGFHQSYWLRGTWFDMFHDFWGHFSTDGYLEERTYPPSDLGKSDVGSLGAQVTLAPGESAVIPFSISWHLPNFVKYWDDPGGGQDRLADQPTWRNYYGTQWEDAFDVARYYAQHAERLYGDTLKFHDTLFTSSLPDYVLDAISSQASILHSPTVLRLEDGTFYGFEGCHCDSGCCEGSCTHVWNYAQTLAFLFPSLERSMREADYRYNLESDGRMGFRLQLPLGSPPWKYHAAADGQMGGLLKLYRDWKLCGDDAWLKALWPRAKQALAFAWQEWDRDQDGVMEGIQHNTYDIELIGANTLTSSLYLGALRAAEEMARYLGEETWATKCRALYERGRAKIDQELFNGEYYEQKEPPADTKYQYGRGCLSDQLIGQWFAHLVGLGYLLNPDHVRSAIHAVFEHNWRTDFWEHANPQRVFALNDEQGLLVCTWPRGGRPAFPLVYCDEVWCGIEYQVASHLIYEGQVREGLSIVKGVRSRHDGYRRNPWNEFECGNHYARSMASWAVLTALSGYVFDMTRQRLGFAPRLWPEDFTCFWSVDGAWGSYHQQSGGGEATVQLTVVNGRLTLAHLYLGSFSTGQVRSAQVGDQMVPAKAIAAEGGLEIVLEPPTVLETGHTLHVALTIHD